MSASKLLAFLILRSASIKTVLNSPSNLESDFEPDACPFKKERGFESYSAPIADAKFPPALDMLRPASTKSFAAFIFPKPGRSPKTERKEAPSSFRVPEALLRSS